MTKEELFKKVELFLSEKRIVKNGGWAEVGKDDLKYLSLIIEGILE